jgi:hypothetical protein
MEQEQRSRIMREFLDRECFPTMEQKGRQSGGGTTNVNQGFYDMASPEAKIDDIHVWWFMFAKQVYRLKHWVFHRGKTPETLVEMIKDVVNYALILYSLLVEDGVVEHQEFLERKGESRSSGRCFFCGQEPNGKFVESPEIPGVVICLPCIDRGYSIWVWRAGT